MFITENQNLADSVLFLLSARQTLADIVEESKVDNAEKMIVFLHNEASDYEVMNLLITGKMPDEKYNQIGEIQLFSILKEQMLRDHELVTEAIGNDLYQNVLHEVDSVFPIMSTATPVLEFMAIQDQSIALACMISEQDTGAIVMPGSIGAKAAAAKGYVSGVAGKVAGAAKGAMAAGKAAALKGLAGLSAFAATPAGMAVGGAAMAALIGYASMKTYKRFFSQAAKACGGMSGPAKTACMGKYKKQAIMKQATDIQRGSSVCAKVKNPEKCKAGVAKKIAGLKAKAAKVAR